MKKEKTSQTEFFRKAQSKLSKIGRFVIRHRDVLYALADFAYKGYILCHEGWLQTPDFYVSLLKDGKVVIESFMIWLRTSKSKEAGSTASYLL